MKDVASEGVSEVCCELGTYYMDEGSYEEAAMWFYNAAYETAAILDIRCSGEIPLYGLSQCYAALGQQDLAKEYGEKAKAWQREV